MPIPVFCGRGSVRARGRLTAAALVGAALLVVALPARAAPPPPRHVVLYYMSEAAMSASNTRPLVGYVRDGVAVDWMFDGLIAFDYTLYNDGTPPTSTEVTSYVTRLFDGGQLATLADTVAALRVELGDPTYRLKVYLTAPYVSGANANTNVQTLLDRWAALGRDELELMGFYWGFEEDLFAGSAATARMRATASYIHAAGYEMVWIPYMSSAGGVDGWRGYGFDHAALQVGYAFGDFDTSRFVVADESMRSWGLSGIELETADVRNPRITDADRVLASGLTYLAQANRCNWAESDWNVFYHGTAIASFATGARRALYDAYYRFVAARPRSSVRAHTRVVTTADTYVEAAVGYQDVNHGADARLNLGTNLYPNANRVYLLFDLVGVPPAEDVLAVHLQLDVREFPYPPTIADAELYEVGSPTWTESELTYASQPSEVTRLSSYRFQTNDSYPVRHSLDVTAQVQAALARGEISFMLRRATEDAVTREATFDSRESGASVAPALQFVTTRWPTPPTDGGAGLDAAMGVDAGARIDGGPARDAGGLDASAARDAGRAGVDEGVGGCGCRVGRDHRPRSERGLAAIAAAAALASAWCLRRRSSR